MAAISDKHFGLVKKLYYKKLQTMQEIADKLEVSLDAVVYFMRHNNLKRRTFQETNRIAFAKKPLSFSLKKKLTNRDKELKAIGTMLYWGEGYKKPEVNPTVDFANSDPAMISVFMNFLRDVCGIDEKRVGLYLYCYSNQNPKKLMEFWSNLTKVPIDRFTKPYVREDFKKEKEGRMPYGLVHIRYCDKKLLMVIIEWIEEYKTKYCVGGRVVNCTSL